MKFNQLGDLVVLTIRNPGVAVGILRSFQLSSSDRWAVMLLAASLSSLLAGLARMMFPVPEGEGLAILFATPFTLAAIQFGAMVLSALAVTVIGRAFGGEGTLPDALLLVGWVELILVGFQAAQLVLMVLIPPTAAMMSVLAFALSIYLTISLTKALHGFTSTVKVVVVFIGSVLMLGMILSIIAGSLGILPEVTP